MGKSPLGDLESNVSKMLNQGVNSQLSAAKSYLHNYGEEMNKMLSEPYEKGLLKTKAQKMSIPELKAEIRARLAKKYPNYAIGRIPILCKDGKIRNYKPEPWAENVARTRSRDFVEMGMHQEMAKAGLDLVVVSVGGSNDACRHWEGKVLSISGETKGYPTVLEARDTGEVFHYNCFIDHQIKIFTSKGRERIGDLKVGDLVLTHKGRYRRINGLIRGQTNGMVRKICLDGWRKYPFMTLDHPVLTKDGWKKISDIKTGDLIKVLSHRCPNCDKKIPIWLKYCSPKSCSDEIDRIMMNHNNEYEFMFVPVVKIIDKKLNRARKTYNISVDEDESYVCSLGIVAHNCVHSTSPFMLYEDETGEFGVLGRDMKDWQSVKDEFGRAIFKLRDKTRTMTRKIAKMPLKTSKLTTAEKIKQRREELDGITTIKGTERWCKKHYPDIEWDLTGCRVGNIKPTLIQFDKLAEEWPEVAGRLKYVGTYVKSTKYKKRGAPFDFEEWAHASKDGKRIGLNPEYYKKPDFLARVMYSADVNWHPAGTGEIESVITHEFGHMVNNYLRSLSKTAISKWVGIEGYEIVGSSKYAFADRNYRTSARTLSNYALRNESEAFAEAFAALYHQPSKMHRAYAKKLKLFLKTYADRTKWTKDWVWRDEMASEFLDEYMRHREGLLKKLKRMGMMK